MKYDKERIKWIDTAVTVAKIVNAHVAPVHSISMVPSPSGDRTELCFLCDVEGSRIPIIVIAITGTDEEILLRQARELKRDIFKQGEPVFLGQGGDA